MSALPEPLAEGATSDVFAWGEGRVLKLFREHYQYAVDLDAGWQQALARLVESQEARCSHDVPGDTQRNLRVHNVVSGVHWKLVLLPTGHQVRPGVPKSSEGAV